MATFNPTVLRASSALIWATTIVACGDDGSDTSGGGSTATSTSVTSTSVTSTSATSSGTAASTSAASTSASSGSNGAGGGGGGTTGGSGGAGASSSAGGGGGGDTGGGGAETTGSGGGGGGPTLTGGGGQGGASTGESASSGGDGGAGGVSSAESTSTAGGQGGAGGDAGSGGAGGAEPVEPLEGWIRGFGDAEADQRARIVQVRDDGGVLLGIVGEEDFAVGVGFLDVVQLSAVGDVEYIVNIPALDQPRFTQLAPLPGGGFVAAREFCEPIDLGGAILTPEPDDCDGFIARYDSDGELERFQVLGGDRDQAIRHVSAIGEDIFVIATSSSGVIDWGDGPRSSFIGLHLARLGPEGEVRWARTIDRPGPDGFINLLGISVDAVGGIALSGQVANQIDFGEVVEAPPGEFAGFVARYDVDGALLGAASFPGTSAFWSADVGPDGRTVLGGSCFRDGCGVDPPSGVDDFRLFAIMDTDHQIGVARIEPPCEQLMRPFWTSTGYRIAGPCREGVDFEDDTPDPTGEPRFTIVRYDASAQLERADRLPYDVSELWATHANGDSIALSGLTADRVDFPFGSYQTLGGEDAWVALVQQPE
jgi:hypothetical protein